VVLDSGVRCRVSCVIKLLSGVHTPGLESPTGNDFASLVLGRSPRS